MKSIKMSCKALLPALAMVFLISCGAGRTEAAAAQPADAGEKVQRQVFAMDTVMLLTAYGENAEAALEAAEARILELEADLDPESETGSVHALNAAAGESVVLSEDAFAVLKAAMEVWERTDGALDPGLYPLSTAWGFIDGNYRVPAREEIDALLAAKDTAGIVLDEETHSATVPVGTEVSFGAVAKGYAAQAVSDLLEEMGVTSAVLSLGGNVQSLGQTKPNGSPWKIAVVDPKDTGSYVGILETGQTAAVTSGGYQRFFEQDGVTYIHILDPETGLPVAGDLTSVTVVTEDGTLADALSTALFVMGKDAALEFYRGQEGFELVLITTDDRVLVTPGLKDAFSGESDGYTYEYLE